MAYAVKYLFKFQSSNGTVREIRVLKDGYSGSVIQRPLGRAPVIKKEQNGGVHGTSLTFYAECHIDREYIEFYTSDPKEYRVDVYAGSTLLWQGYITPELYSEPDIAPPYDVQVVATDGVGELKLYDFTPQGIVTLRALLTYLLGHTGLTTDVNLISSLKPGSHGAGALLDMQICVDYLAGKTCYEALTYILDTLHATITRWGGAWLLVRETNVTFTSDKVRYFNTSGNSALLAGSVQTLGAMRSAPAWPVGQLSTVIDPAKNKVVVQAPWHPVTCLANPDMASDTGWTKANNASYGPDGYLLPNNDTGGSTYATAHISQALSLAGMRTPLSFELRATGVAAQVGARVGAVIGVLLTYTVGSTVYLLRKGDEGTPVWKQGSAPGSSIDGSLVDYQQPLASFDADRIQAETLRIDEIPAFVQGTSYPSGTLTVYVVGSCARVYGAHLDVVLPKGYQDILRIDNGARGEGDSVEIAIGRQTADVAYYQAFLQGLLLDSGSLITAFSDANFTTAMDYLALISRDYALSAALPRALAKGTVYLESTIGMPPLVFAKGGLNYWLETWAWNLYEDELEINARTLPSASLTVQSETILESDGSTVSSGSSGSSGGGSSISPGGGTNYFQIDEDLQTLLEPKPQFDFLSPKKGLIFDTVPETDVASSPAHLMLRNLGTQSEPNYALYTPFALITGGDQIVMTGTPGGGGGGAGYLYELGDIYHDTDKTKVLRTDGTTPAAVGDVLQLTALTGGNKWAAVPATDIGRVYSGGTGITINGNEISVTANTYLPLAGGNMTGPIHFKGASAYMSLARTDGGTAETWFAYDATTQILGPAAGTTTIRSGYASLYHYRGNTSYEIYTAHNLTKSVLTGLLDASGGYYLPLTGGTIAVSTATAGNLLKINNGYSSGTLVYVNFQLGGTSKAAVGYNSTYAFLSNETTAARIGVNDSGTPIYMTSYLDASPKTIYHSGNSNKSDVAWSASSLTLNGAISGATSITATSSINTPCVNIIATSTPYIYTQSGDDSLSYITDSTTGFTFNSRRSNAWAADLYLKHSNGYFGIGTSSPTQALDVNGTIRGKDIVYFQNTAGTANMGFVGRASGSADYFYVWNTANGNMYFGTNNTTRMTINAGGGITMHTQLNINAETSAPLSINNSATNATASYMIARVGATNKAEFGFSSTWGAYMYDYTSGYYVNISGATSTLYWNNTNPFYHSGNSNNLTTPWTCKKLQLNSFDNPETGIVFRNGIDSTSLIYNCSIISYDHRSTSTNLADGISINGYSGVSICTGSNTRQERFRIDQSGNVYIGGLPANFTAKFCIYTSGAESQIALYSDGTGGDVAMIYEHRGAGNGLTFAELNRDFIWRTGSVAGGGGGTERMRLTNNGALLLSNGYSGASSTNIFSATASFSAGGMMTFLFGKAASTNNQAQLIYYHAGDGSTSNKLYFGFYNNWNLSYLDAAGNFVTTGDQVISSDERLKTIVKPVDMTVEQLAGMRAVIYDRKDSGVRSLGVIAQDWEKVLPESVNQGEYLTFKYAQTAMVSAILLAKHETEQDKEIRKLREKVQKLEMDNLRLKARLGLEN